MALLKFGGPTAKVGHGVPTFNLPAIETCPGATHLCRSVCYATRAFYRRDLVRAVYAEALEVSQGPWFVTAMHRELSRLKPGTAVRLHSSGDFYSTDYLAKWIWLCRTHHALRFWGYTRSWRLPGVGWEAGLRELATLPNVELFASVDDETGEPPAWMRRALIVERLEDAPASAAACPYQKNRRNTCARCTYCFKPQGMRKTDVAFLRH